MRKTVICRGLRFSKYEIESDNGMIYRVGKDDYIKPWDDKRGYLVVEIMTDEGIPVKVKNHIACAHTFLGPQYEGFVVNHIDGNKHNPALNNIEYATYAENVAHAQVLIKNKEYLSPDKYIGIINAINSSKSIQEVSKEFNINSWILRDIIRGKTYKQYKDLVEEK